MHRCAPCNVCLLLQFYRVANVVIASNAMTQLLRKCGWKERRKGKVRSGGVLCGRGWCGWEEGGRGEGN